MPWVGFEPTISAGERPKTYALDRAAAGTGREPIIKTYFQATVWEGVDWIYLAYYGDQWPYVWSKVL